MAKTTLFELKEKMATLQAAIAADAEWIAEMAREYMNTSSAPGGAPSPQRGRQ